MELMTSTSDVLDIDTTSAIKTGDSDLDDIHEVVKSLVSSTIILVCNLGYISLLHGREVRWHTDSFRCLEMKGSNMLLIN